MVSRLALQLWSSPVVSCLRPPRRPADLQQSLEILSLPIGSQQCRAVVPIKVWQLTAGCHVVQTDAAVLVLLILCTALFATLAGVDSRQSHYLRRAQWFAILLGPFGAVMRWQLSKLNFKLPGRAQWFPAGTFAANMIACCVDYALEVRSCMLLLLH